MIVMHGINAKKKFIDALLRQKIKSDVFTTDLVEKAFFAYGEVKLTLSSFVIIQLSSDIHFS